MEHEIKIFMISFLLVSLVAALVFGGYSVYLERKSIIQDTYEHLKNIVESKAENVNSFLEAKKARAVDFSSDGFIKSSLIKLEQGEDFLQISEDLKNHLEVNKMPIEENIYELYVLDANGEEVAETEHEKPEGYEEAKHEELEELYLNGKNKPYVKEVFYDEEFGAIGMAFSAPITSNGNFLGVIIIKIFPGELGEVVERGIEIKGTEEVYIINKEEFLVTPSRFLRGEGGVLIQKIDTRNSKACFKDFEKHEGDIKELEEHEKKIIGSFKDYKGDEVLGVHKHMPEIGACLLAEIEIEKVNNLLKNFIKNQIIISLILVAIFSLMGFFTGKYFEKKRERIK